MAATSSLLLANFQVFWGLRVMMMSVRLTVMGSLAISGRPVLLITESTSGNCLRHCSMRVVISTLVSSETLGRRTAWIAMDPSSSLGMNSPPRPKATIRLAKKASAVAPKTMPGTLMTKSRSGW